MKALITGGCGFIGSHTVDLFCSEGWEVLVIDDLSTGRREQLDSRAALAPMSILARNAVALGVEFKPDVIVHLAAQPSLRASLDNPVQDARINVVGTLQMLEVARVCGSKFIFASTSAVYGDYKGMPYLEDDLLLPTLPYGIAKMSAETYIRHSGIRYAILRYGNVYGPRQVEVGENQLVPHCLRHLLEGAPFSIHGDGSRTRDFVYVGDVARANLWATGESITGIFHIATGIQSAVAEVCEILAQQCGVSDTVFQHDADKEGEAWDVGLVVQKAAHLDWRHETELAEGLAKTVESWTKEKELV